MDGINPLPNASRMDEVCRYCDIGKRRMDEFVAPVKNTATLAFSISHAPAGLQSKKTCFPHLFPVINRDISKS